MRIAAADHLTREFGEGHWSTHTNEAAVLREMRASRVVTAHADGVIVGTLTLQTRKPWSIDVTYFTPCKKPIYLTNMAVVPERQRSGVGRALLDAALAQARVAMFEAVRLDAYDAPAGAGPFYRRCGYHHVGGQSYRGVPLMYFERMTGAAS